MLLNKSKPRSNMDFDLLQRRRQGKTILKKNPLSKQVKKSISMLIFTLLSIIVLLSIVFLLNTSQSFQQGIVFQQEQLKKDQLELRNRELVSKIIEAMSFQKVEQSDIVKSMTKPESPIYIPKEEEQQ